MTGTQERLAESLTAQTTALLPYLPYLLQDLFELSANKKVIEDILTTHTVISPQLCVLDLACGKGAVPIHLAKTFGCKAYGIDMMPAFIDEANSIAKKQGIADCCTFEVGDVNKVVDHLRGYDVVIMTDVSGILGCSEVTMHKLKSTVREGGYVLIEDAYAANDSELVATRTQWMDAFKNAGLRLISETASSQTEIVQKNNEDLAFIEQRVREMIEMHPDKRVMFEQYIMDQKAEANAAAHDWTCATWLLNA